MLRKRSLECVLLPLHTRPMRGFVRSPSRSLHAATLAIAPEIAGRERDRVEPRSKRQGQAHQGASKIELRQGAAGRDDLRHPWQAFEQGLQRLLNLEYHASAQVRNQFRVAAKLQRVAEPLLAVQQDGLP